MHEASDEELVWNEVKWDKKGTDKLGEEMQWLWFKQWEKDMKPNMIKKPQNYRNK